VEHLEVQLMQETLEELLASDQYTHLAAAEEQDGTDLLYQ
jgi:hypothetical protein